MRKHLYGFALFVFIVASGATVKAFLFNPPLPDVGYTTAVPEPSDMEEPGDVKDPFSYEVKSFQIDLEKRLAIIEIKLDWRSKERPPWALWLNFGVARPDQPYNDAQATSGLMKDPFRDGNSVTRNFTSPVSVYLPLSEKNYYGYVEIFPRPERNVGVKNLVFIRKNRMAGAVPILILHPKKIIGSR